MRQRAVVLAASVSVVWVVTWLWFIHRSGLHGAPLRLVGFGHEWMFLAPIWLVGLAVLPWLWLGASRTLTDFAPLQTTLSAIVRSVLVLAILCALARPAMTSYGSRVSVVALVDVSTSVSDDQLASAAAFIDSARKQVTDGELHVITFAKDAQVAELKERTVFGRPPQTTDLADATDLAAAMQLGEALFSPSMVRRFVLLTDGRETQGNAVAEATHAAAMDIRIDVADLPPRQQPEVLLRRISLPARITIGRPFEIRSEIVATHAGPATFTLQQGEFPNPLEPQRQLALKAGVNHVSLRSIVRHPGTVTYRGAVAVPNVHADTVESNNRQIATAVVAGRPRVLVCDGEPDKAAAFADTLRLAQFEVDVRGPQGLPRLARDLEAYDLVVLSDVPVAFVGPREVSALQTYVRDLGGGLLFAAGPSILGQGADTSVAVETLLPVTFHAERKRDEPTLALVLAIDKSGSMAGQKIDLAKEAARATADVLAASDLIGVVAFDSQPLSLVRLQRAGVRSRIAGEISKLAASGGTNILPALQEAHSQLLAARARIKHVILLSDGQSSYQGIRELAEEMAQSRITISTVGVGDGADRTMLAQIAEWGGGRFYFTQDAAAVPRIFLNETHEVQRTSTNEEQVFVRAAKRGDVLAGVAIEKAPPLRGYVTAQAKPQVEVFLVSQHDEPLLARWRVGLGKVTAWTSDVKPRWSAGWMAWPGFSKLWAQVARDTMRARAAQRFDMDVEVANGQAHVVVNALDRAYRFIDGLQGELVVVNPDRPGVKRKFPLEQTAPGRYDGYLPTEPTGSLVIRADLQRGGQPMGEAAGTVAAAYPAEFSDLTTNEPLLKALVQTTGGQLQTTPAQLFDARGDRVQFEHEWWPRCLAAAALLLIVDLILRRVRIFGRTVVPAAP